MASSEVDQKFLGKLAKAVEQDNPLLAAMLFMILGLSINLSQELIQARKLRRRDPAKSPEHLELYFHIIWLSREGLVMLEQYVLPVVGKYVELKVLAYKLRASFYHIFVLFYNQPPVSTMGLSTPDIQGSFEGKGEGKGKGKDKGTVRDDDYSMDAQSTRSSLQPTHPMEGGPVQPAVQPSVQPPPGFGPEPPAAFLLPTADYLPLANRYFKDAITLAEDLLWGSHSLRLSVKTEYAAFLYECVHDVEGSRKLAKDTIAEVYEAAEGIDNDMFGDACELVTILGKMMKRGLSASSSSRAKGASRPSRPAQQQTEQQQQMHEQQIQQQIQQLQQQQQQQQQQTRKRAASSARPGHIVPPPIPPTTSAPMQPIHPDDMVEFI